MKASYVLATVIDAGDRPSGMMYMKFLGEMAPKAAGRKAREIKD
jgi:hypothetical protein